MSSDAWVLSTAILFSASACDTAPDPGQSSPGYKSPAWQPTPNTKMIHRLAGNPNPAVTTYNVHAEGRAQGGRQVLEEMKWIRQPRYA